ncbi:30S ribosomal protein S20 [Patescibacteria group bacterium]|nr:30S ribosomal protein S20 [Patescibacteria group bacterium]MBU1890617.1 30S ribosomal protein S20 [Patescibacteria group bacterium]
MPAKKAALKSIRQDKKRHARNLKTKNEIKRVVKTARKFISEGNKEKASETVKKAVKIIDKATQHKIIKKNTASRKKSRLNLAVNKIDKSSSKPQ